MDIPPDEVLPCGCVIRCTIVAGVNTITIAPCHLSCRNFINALELADEKGLTTKYRNA